MAKNSSFVPTDTESVWIAEAPGFHESTDPTVAVLGGVHGDEETGKLIVDRMREKGLNLDAGRVILALGNPVAAALGVRGTTHNGVRQNLNREFILPDDPRFRWRDVEPERRPYEARRAQELVPYLDQADAALDLHDFTDKKGPKFIITEPRGFEVARKIGAPIISSGWSEAEPGGTDGFMNSLERVGICYELGDKTKGEENFRRGMGAVIRFLIAYGMYDGHLPPLFAKQGEPRFIWNERAFKRVTNGKYELLLPEDIRTFDRLEEGQPIANLDGEQVKAEKGQVIIFPMKPDDTPVGSEAFSVGREFTSAA